MTAEEKRIVIAEALAKTRSLHGWVFSPDNSIPRCALFAKVYDGAEPMCSLLGAASPTVHELISRSKMPILFYLPAKSVGLSGGTKA